MLLEFCWFTRIGTQEFLKWVVKIFYCNLDKKIKFGNWHIYLLWDIWKNIYFAKIIMYSMNNSSVHGLKYKAVVKPKNRTCYHTNNDDCMQWGAIWQDTLYQDIFLWTFLHEGMTQCNVSEHHLYSSSVSCVCSNIPRLAVCELVCLGGIVPCPSELCILLSCIGKGDLSYTLFWREVSVMRSSDSPNFKNFAKF